MLLPAPPQIVRNQAARVLAAQPRRRVIRQRRNVAGEVHAQIQITQLVMELSNLASRVKPRCRRQQRQQRPVNELLDDLQRAVDDILDHLHDAHEYPVQKHAHTMKRRLKQPHHLVKTIPHAADQSADEVRQGDKQRAKAAVQDAIDERNRPRDNPLNIRPRAFPVAFQHRAHKTDDVAHECPESDQHNLDGADRAFHIQKTERPIRNRSHDIRNPSNKVDDAIQEPSHLLAKVARAFLGILAAADPVDELAHQPDDHSPNATNQQLKRRARSPEATQRLLNRLALFPPFLQTAHQINDDAANSPCNSQHPREKSLHAINCRANFVAFLNPFREAIDHARQHPHDRLQTLFNQ